MTFKQLEEYTDWLTVLWCEHCYGTPDATWWQKYCSNNGPISSAVAVLTHVPRGDLVGS
jgi:hypothetical protein